MRGPRHPIRRHHQRLAHQPGVRADHRLEPLLRVHVPRQLVLQPRVAESARFLRDDDTFDIDSFTAAVELVTTAMDISICFADFPTEAIAKTTRDSGRSASATRISARC